MIVKRLLLVVQLASILFFIGCRGESGTKTAANEIVVALSASPSTLDPRFATDAAGMRLGNLLFQSLVRLGPDLNIIGDAAETWTYDPRKMEYVFNLKPNLKFWDNSPVTEEDIEYSIDQFRATKSPFQNAYRSISSVQVNYGNGKNRVAMRLSKFSASLLTDLSPLKILPKKLVQKFGDDFGKNLMGSGPFRLKSHDDNEIVLERIDPSSIALVRFKVIRDEATRYLKVLKGEIDLAQSELPYSKIAQLEKTGQFEVVKYPSLSMTYLLLNLQDPFFAKIENRRALSQAINRDEIIKYKLEGFAEPATSILSPANPFHNKDLKNLPYDTAASKLVFDSLTNKSLTLKTSNAQPAVENGRVLADQFGKVGLQVQTQSFEWGTFYGDIQKGNFQMATMKWVGSTDPDIYRVAFLSSEVPPIGRNRGHYVNKTLDALLVKGLEIVDPIERNKFYLKIQQIVHDDLPIIPLWYEQEVVVMNKALKDYSISKFGDYSGLLNAKKEGSADAKN